MMLAGGIQNWPQAAAMIVFTLGSFGCIVLLAWIMSRK
jgi:hypothetical protein